MKRRLPVQYSMTFGDSREEIDARFCSPFSPYGSKRSMGPVEGV